jgi:hypothetical protein
VTSGPNPGIGRRLIEAGVAAAVLVAALALLAGMSRVPWHPESGSGSTLRLSWRVRGELEQRCRQATAEEMAAQAAHMRQTTVCDPPRVAPYRLTVRLNDTTVHRAQLRGSGRAGEGTLYIIEEFAVAPGPQRLSVRLERLGDSHAAPTEAVAADTRRPTRHAVPPLLTLDTTVMVAGRRVVLVTYDAEREALVIAGTR